MKANLRRLEIVLNGVDACSGSCPFCTESQSTGMTKGIRDLISLDNHIYQRTQFDFDNLEKTITEHPYWTDLDKTRFVIWGGDPLTSFLSIQELVDFLEYLETKYNHKVMLNCSTNGLAFTRDEVKDYVIKHNIGVQLSHDGLGQKYRTGDIDPLELDNVKELVERKVINSVYTVLCNYNPNVIKNIEHFKKYDIIPFTRRIEAIRDSDYQFNLAKESADEFIDSLRQVYLDLWNPDYLPYRTALVRNLSVQLNHKPTQCNLYQAGITDKSNIIDTLGKYSECHLLDSNQHVPNPSHIKPDYCKDCKYQDKFRCNLCGTAPFSKECDFNYKYNALLEELLKDNNLIYLVAMYRRGQLYNNLVKVF